MFVILVLLSISLCYSKYIVTGACLVVPLLCLFIYNIQTTVHNILCNLLLQHVMQKIQGTAFQKMCADIASSLNLGTPSFAAAKDFLQGAGQGTIIQQVSKLRLHYNAVQYNADSIIMWSLRGLKYFSSIICVKMSAGDRGIHNVSCENRTPCVFPNQV